MNAREIETALKQQIMKDSGLDQHRNYLGISKLHDCPCKVYREYFAGVTTSEQAHRMCYAGYHHEENVIRLLQRAEISVMDCGMEIASPLDSRLRGHIDGRTPDGDLIEVKSVNPDKFRRISEDGRAAYAHYAQVQMYMKYGGWRRAHLIYRNRDTYEHLVIEVPYSPATADKLERKAAMILGAIDAQTPPECTCGKCER